MNDQKVPQDQFYPRKREKIQNSKLKRFWLTGLN